MSKQSYTQTIQDSSSLLLCGSLILGLSLLATYSGTENLFALIPLFTSVGVLSFLYIYTKAATQNCLSAAATTLVLGTSLGWTYSVYTYGANAPGLLRPEETMASCSFPYSQLLCFAESTWSTSTISLILLFLPWSLLLPLAGLSLFQGLLQFRSQRRSYDYTMALALLVWICIALAEPLVAYRTTLLCLIPLAYFTGLSIDCCSKRSLGRYPLYISCALVFAACCVMGLICSSILYLSYLQDPSLAAPQIFSPAILPLVKAVLTAFSSSASAFILLLLSIGLGVLALKYLWQGQIRYALWTIGTSMVLIALCTKLILISSWNSTFN